jgi:hypothetical protein
MLTSQPEDGFVGELAHLKVAAEVAPQRVDNFFRQLEWRALEPALNKLRKCV